eukprot:GFUD01009138.1.p1 GENE.GFUD01009138.1~~GFUD01009138.1.p1  ORF type:complete len:554 (+),score=92.28 GFUD01009138.1:111-1772(+)
MLGSKMVKMIVMTILLMSPLARAGFTKCCPAGQILDLHTKNCIQDSFKQNGAFVANVTILPDFNTKEEEIVFEKVPTGEVYLCPQSLRYHFSWRIFRKKSEFFIIDLDRNLKNNQENMCIDNALDSKTSVVSLVGQGCLSCTEEEPCVNFCCPRGQVIRNGACVDDERVHNILQARQYKQVNVKLHCSKSVTYPRSLWNLTSKGEMEVDGAIRNASEYCIAVWNEGEPSLLLCPMEDEAVDYKHILKMVCMCLSMLSILIIILFHVLIEDLWTQHFTKLKIPFFVCLLLSFLVIVITSLQDFTGTSSCLFWALTLQYFSLAIFFWLTSMSLDIWLAFRIMANPTQNFEKKEAQLKSRIKCFYFLSFGCPLIVTIVTWILQLATDPEDSSYIHPRIGVSCMLGQYQPQFLYFHLIILVLLSINGVFYCLMVFKFTCGIWSEDSFGKTQMRNFRVFLELVFIMGINWISEIVVFFVGWKAQYYWDHPLLVFVSSINWLIGIFILLLFCSKSTNRNLVRNLLFQSREDPDYYNLARTFSTQLSDKDETFRVLDIDK